MQFFQNLYSVIRSAKSGSDWTENELFAFNIIIQDVDVATFFGVPHLLPTTVSPVILNNALQPDLPVSKDDRLFLERANIGEEATVDDFAGHILRMLNFDDEGRLIASKRELSLTMCGTRVCHGQRRVLAYDESELRWIVFGHASPSLQRTTVTDEPKPQLVAEAIAGFVENNRLRAHPLSQKTFPAITMVGPCPIFYKIPVTQALVDALITAQYHCRAKACAPCSEPRLISWAWHEPAGKSYDRLSMFGGHARVVGELSTLGILPVSHSFLFSDTRPDKRPVPVAVCTPIVVLGLL